MPWALRSASAGSVLGWGHALRGAVVMPLQDVVLARERVAIKAVTSGVCPSSPGIGGPESAVGYVRLQAFNTKASMCTRTAARQAADEVHGCFSNRQSFFTPCPSCRRRRSSGRLSRRCRPKACPSS